MTQEMNVLTNVVHFNFAVIRYGPCNIISYCILIFGTGILFLSSIPPG